MGQQAKEEMQAGQQINGEIQIFRLQDEARHSLVKLFALQFRNSQKFTISPNVVIPS